MSNKRTFGTVRKLPSGRYQASYWNEGLRYTGPRTFDTLADANAYLSETETDIRKRLWIDPDAGSVTFRTYADQWMTDRMDLLPRRGACIASCSTSGYFPTLEIRPSVP